MFCKVLQNYRNTSKNKESHAQGAQMHAVMTVDCKYNGSDDDDDERGVDDAFI